MADLATLISIASPMSGQIVFVVDKASIYQYDGTQWSSLGTSFEIINGDSVTCIRVDNGSDNDVIEFTAGCRLILKPLLLAIKLWRPDYIEMESNHLELLEMKKRLTLLEDQIK